MLIFTENIPQTSEVTPLISKFFIAILFEVAVCLIGTSVTLRFYHFSDPEEEIPAWVDFFVFGCLARVLRMKLNVKSSENRETIRSKRQSKGATFLSKLLICKGGAHASLSGSQMEVKKCCELRNPLDKRLEETTHKICDIYGRVVEQENVAGNKDKWHFAASVIDRFFLVLSGVTICLSVITFIL